MECVVCIHCSSPLNQCRGGVVNSAAQGVDSEGDEFDDDQDDVLDDSEASDDSDPELASSPRFIRQTNLSACSHTDLFTLSFCRLLFPT